MERKSRKRAWLAAIIIAFLTAVLLLLPYIIGHQNAPNGTVYTGLLVNLEDGTYLSAIEQGRSGAWLYQSHFTVEQHEPVFLEGFYLFLGQVGRLFNLSTISMWHIGQFGTNLFLFMVMFGFISLFLSSNQQRLSAYLLAIFGAGFDWWKFPAWFERQAAYEVVPIDFKFPGAHLFYSALTFPHFMAGIALILIVFGTVFYLLVLEKEGKISWLLAAAAGVANLLVGVVYPFLIYLTAAVVGTFYIVLLVDRYRRSRSGEKSFLWGSLLDLREVGKVAVVFLIPLPLYIYYAFVFLESPVLQRWNEQAFTPSPNPLHYLLTYGLYLLLGLLVPLKMWRNRSEAPGNDRGAQRFFYRLTFLWVWLGVAGVLLYLPINAQRRFVQGLQIPLSIVAVIGFYQVVWPWLVETKVMKGLLKRPRYSERGMQKLTMLALIGLAGISNSYLYASTLIGLGVNQSYPLFRPEAEIEAMAWLAEKSEPGAVVLAGYRTGSYLPFRSGVTVLVGNRYETYDFIRKRAETAEFFQAETSDEWRQELLAENHVDYVFVGPEERRMGAEDDLENDFLRIVYQNDKVTIYSVHLR